MVKALSDPTHELHRRRFGRNLGIGLSLAAVAVLVFALTLVKIAREEPAAAAAPQDDAMQAEGAAAVEGMP